MTSSAVTGSTGDTLAVTLPNATAVRVTREIAAPPHAVYRACTEPDLVRRWWSGGEGEVTVADVDLRVGGRWRFVVEGDGYQVGLHGVYHDIVPSQRITCTEVDEDRADAEADAALCTYTFTATGGHTVLSLLTELPTPDHREALLDSGMEQGLAETWDHLERVALSLR